MNAITTIVAIIAILAIVYFAVQYMQNRVTPSTGPGINVDVNPGSGNSSY
jgi:cell division protein YceG involved in septum cleavage